MYPVKQERSDTNGKNNKKDTERICGEAEKRYSYTAKGKVKRTSANARHRLATKTKRQKSDRKINSYADKSCENTIKKLLPYGN